MRSRRYLCLAVALSAAGLAAAAPSGAPRAVSAAQYRQAEQYLPGNADARAYRLQIAPHWLPDGRFWYRVRTAQGIRFVLIDPSGGTREPAFDAALVAAELSTASGRAISPSQLNPADLAFTAGDRDITFTFNARRWQCARQGDAVERRGTPRGRAARCILLPLLFPPANPAGPPVSISPDGTREVFLQHWNLWLRDRKTGAVQPITTDGVKNFGYATDNAGWTSSDRPIVLWSPDSSKIATYQQDQRGVGHMYLVPVVAGHPQLVTQVYPLPGDPTVTTIQRVIIDLNQRPPRVVRLQMRPDQHRSTLRDDLAFGPDEDVQWSPDGTSLAFISTSRDHKHEWLRVASASTGAVRTVYEESVATEYTGGQGGSNFRYLPEAGEFLWYSQRDNLGQLYLYDLHTGQLIRQVTRHAGNVDHVVYLDRRGREVYFIATAGTDEANPYYQQLYRASLDHPGEQRLTPEAANHNIHFSPDGRYFVDTFSTPDTPPVSVLRSADGRLIMRLETADISRLVASGWKPPVQIKVKARDGKTALYGLMFTPFQLVPGRRYPIINHIYPGPQTGSVETRNFVPAHGDDEALAQLGFVVVELDGMGTPWRGRLFHDAYYGNMKDNTLPDQVAGMRQLAKMYPFIDLSRAGIWGHSGGGDAAADALFRYPGFFQVGVAESGNHDQRDYEDDWGERYMGLDVPAGAATTYSGQSNESVAKNLRGHLLLAHGTLDDNVPMNNTLLVVQALIQANKDFDLILLPNQHHGYGPDAPYMMRRRWDYFVRYLLGATPPHEFRMQIPNPK